MDFALLSDKEKTGLLVEFVLNAEFFNKNYDHEDYNTLRLVKDDKHCYIFEFIFPEDNYMMPGRLIKFLTRKLVREFVHPDIIDEFNRLQCCDQHFYIDRWLATFKHHDTIFFCSRCSKREPDTIAGHYFFCKVKDCRGVLCSDCYDERGDECIFHSSLHEMIRHKLL